MNSISKIIGIFVLAIITFSCDSSQSLQQYYVNSKENTEFISVDLPSSILQLKDDQVSEDIKNTLNTIIETFSTVTGDDVDRESLIEFLQELEKESIIEKIIIIYI